MSHTLLELWLYTDYQLLRHGMSFQESPIKKMLMGKNCDVHFPIKFPYKILIISSMARNLPRKKKKLMKK